MPRINYFFITLGVVLATVASNFSFASPEDDLQIYQKFFTKRFSYIPIDEFANGVYAINESMRENWEAIEEFPPYELSIEHGEEMWNASFTNGKSYKDCFPKGPAIQQHYPKWDAEKSKVITLALAINNCREENNEIALAYMKGSINDILSYLAYQSRGQLINVVVPEDNPQALQAYNEGKEFYFTRRGQLNFACYQCHFKSAGLNLRSEVLSPALGQTTGWPVYRSKWGSMGTLHRRYAGCNKQVRAKPFAAQSKEYRNLEYFHTYMSNGLKLNGPAARK